MCILVPNSIGNSDDGHDAGLLVVHLAVGGGDQAVPQLEQQPSIGLFSHLPQVMGLGGQGGGQGVTGGKGKETNI